MIVQKFNSLLPDHQRLAARGWPVLTVTLVLLVMALHLAPFGHNQLRLAQLTLMAVALPYLCLRQSLLHWPGSRVASVSLALFLLLGVVSSSIAYAPPYAFMELGLLSLLLLMAWAIGREMQVAFAPCLTWVLAIVAAGCAAYVLQVGIGYAIFLSLGQMPQVGDLIANFENYRVLNYAQTITLPMVVLLCCMTTNPRVRNLLILVASCWWALLLATGGRGAILGIGVAAVTVLLLRRRHAWRFCVMVAVTALIGYLINKAVFFALPVSLGLEPFGLMTDMAQRTGVSPVSGRNLLWQRCIDLMIAHPVLGVGPLHFAHHGMDLNVGSSPHSWLFQFGTEWGVPALVSLCVVLAGAVGALYQCAVLLDASDTAQQQIATGLLAIGVAILVDGLVSGSLVLPVSQLLIALYTGCACGWVWSRTEVRILTTFQRMAVIGGMLLAALAVSLGVLVDLPHVLGKGANGAPEKPADTYYPRFWLDGRF